MNAYETPAARQTHEPQEADAREEPGCCYLQTRRNITANLPHL